MPINNLIQLRKGTSSQWSSSNPVLASGEPGYDVTGKVLKIGDGITAWNSLSGISSSNGGGGSSNYDPANVDITGGSINGTSIGLSTAGTGNFSSLSITGIPVSISGHSHISSQITNFNSSVSGLVNGIYAPLSGATFSGPISSPTGTFPCLISNDINSSTDNGNINLVSVGSGNVTIGRDIDPIQAKLYVNTSLNAFPQAIRAISSNNASGIFSLGINATSTSSGIESTNIALYGYADNGQKSNYGLYIHKGHGIFNNKIAIRDQTNDAFDLSYIPQASVDISGSLVAQSGSFTQNLKVNNVNVSVSGHTHTASNITDFNSSVSGLLPTISNSGDNRLLTSIGSSIGVNAEANLTFDGNLLSVNGNIVAISGTYNQLVFNTSLADPALSQGQLQWNASEGTLDLGFTNTYSQHVGEELHYRVRNNTASIITKGTVVYASGLTPGGNNRIEIAPFTADGSVREVRLMGLVTENISNGVNGYTTQFGHIRNIDTRGDASTNGYINKLWDAGEPSWSEGDVLYAHPTAAGKLTKVEPKHSISVAIILNRHQNQGKIFVRPISYGHLSDNHDVNVSGVAGGQFLQYDSVTDFWIPSNSGNFSSLQVNGTGVSISGHTHTSSNITDFNSSVSGLLPVKNILQGSNITVTSVSGEFTINSTATGGGTVGSSVGSDLFLWSNFR